MKVLTDQPYGVVSDVTAVRSSQKQIGKFGFWAPDIDKAEWHLLYAPIFFFWPILSCFSSFDHNSFTSAIGGNMKTGEWGVTPCRFYFD